MEDPQKNSTSSLRHLWDALGYALAGLHTAYKSEAAFRQELLLAALLIPLALVLPVGAVGQALLIASVLLVIVAELVNSAIEATLDRISLERHDLTKRAKDLGSAAVLVSLVNVIVVWGLVLMHSDLAWSRMNLL